MADNRVLQERNPRPSGFECLPVVLITENILSRLPLIEAARTSLLSREWRHRWRSIPRLEFSGQSVPRLLHPTDEEASARKIVKAVDRALLHHVGPIREFVLSEVLRGCPDVDSWISVLAARRDVQKIVLSFSTLPEEENPFYRVPCCLFDCDALVYLELSDCSLRLPPDRKGFSSLKTLRLHRALCPNDELSSLIASCPLLNDLSLRSCFHYNERLRIVAPNLRRLSFDGVFQHLIVGYAPSLEDAYIHSYMLEVGIQTDGSSNMVRFFAPLSSLRKLVIDCSAVSEFLAAEGIPDRLPQPLCHLRIVNMCIGSSTMKSIKVVLCLCRSAHVLEDLTIFVDAYAFIPGVVKEVDGGKTAVWGSQDGAVGGFDHLRKVYLGNISGGGPEMALAKIILANAPVLQKLTIELNEYVSKSPARFRKQF